MKNQVDWIEIKSVLELLRGKGAMAEEVRKEGECEDVIEQGHAELSYLMRHGGEPG